jgi:hypothetical protein
MRPAAALAVVATVSLTGLSVAGASSSRSQGDHPFRTSFLSHFSTAMKISSTVPSNGDVNPYGIVVVPHSDGALVRGDTLISNFNDSTNTQGTGTTLVEVSPSGTLTTFATLTDPISQTCPGGVGLTTALAILSNNYVVVGSLPVDETGGSINGPGCLIVVSPEGQAVAMWSSPDINGPWDMTAAQHGPRNVLFISNVLNGTVAAGSAGTNQGTVLRLTVKARSDQTPVVTSSLVVATGFDEQLNDAALVLGPTGLALGSRGTLYVADTVNSRIAAIPRALSRHDAFSVPGGTTLTAGGSLNQPLGLVEAPNGDLIAVNAANGNAVEVTPHGVQSANVTIDPLNSGGDLFGLAIAPHHRGVLFVDDGDNTLQLFH